MTDDKDLIARGRAIAEQLWGARAGGGQRPDPGGREIDPAGVWLACPERMSLAF